jgi:hypothetical protein
MNKKGYDNPADLAMFLFTLLFIGIPIILAMYVFYSSQADVRGEESRILAEALFDGVVEHGRIRETIFSPSFDIFENARIDKRIIENGDFYFRVEITGDNEHTEFSSGNPDFKVFCELSGKNFPACVHKTVLIDDIK